MEWIQRVVGHPVDGDEIRTAGRRAGDRQHELGSLARPRALGHLPPPHRLHAAAGSGLEEHAPDGHPEPVRDSGAEAGDQIVVRADLEHVLDGLDEQ